MPKLYVHFTSPEHAQAIVHTLRLLPCAFLSGLREIIPNWKPPLGHKCKDAWECPVCSGAGTVYAQVEGGAYVPSVQRGISKSGFGRVTGLRTAAVVFVPERDADSVSGEEVEWGTWDMQTPLVLQEAVVVSAEEAIELLGSKWE
jgi:hypothetical protein